MVIGKSGIVLSRLYRAAQCVPQDQGIERRDKVFLVYHLVFFCLVAYILSASDFFYVNSLGAEQ